MNADLHGPNDTGEVDVGHGRNACHLLVAFRNVRGRIQHGRAQMPEQFHERVKGALSLEERLAKDGVAAQCNTRVGNVARELNLFLIADGTVIG